MQRIIGLDILRSIAILLVLLMHSVFVFPASVSKFFENIIPGYAGVSVFFVLSGYLIGGILLRIVESGNFSSHDLKIFWVRRWLRTLPNYFLVLMFLVVYDGVVHEAGFSIPYRHLFFCQNLFTKNTGIFPESWSLSIEEWFYLLLPLLCYLGFKTRYAGKSIVIVVACFFIIAPTLARLIAFQRGSIPPDWLVGHIVVFRLDALMYGVVGAYIHRYHPLGWSNFKYFGLWISGALLVLMSGANFYLPDDSSFKVVYTFTLQAIMALAALPYFSELVSIKSSRLTRVFTFIAAISYSLYVLNLSVMQWRLVPAFVSITHLGDLAGNDASWISFFVFWPFAFGGAYLLYRFFEKPIMDLRRGQ